MAFVPPSSLASGSAAVVAVSNFPAVQTVSGTVTADQGASGAAAWPVDGSAVTQPISVSELPLPDGAADNETLSEIALMAMIHREALEIE